MRLLKSDLNSSDSLFGQFLTALNRPSYAILSHTWGREEITFEDVKRGKSCFTNKKGYAKLQGCCNKAREDGYEWVWIDTCCIDKSNSVELAEAINSMYLWYKQSSVCYAYLSDVPTMAQFSGSKWFTRGWTLQETIASEYLEFYSQDWHVLGTKRSLGRIISVVTGIPEPILSGESPDSCPVAQKMSWAARRTTTKPEDMAYCLMGIFHVNMPMLYGEGGSEAFHRLQRGIMEITEDHTLFTWHRPPGALVNLGFLANSPRVFLPSSKSSSKYDPTQLQPVHPAAPGGNSEPPLLTGRGLRIQIPLLPEVERLQSDEVESTYLAVLNVKHTKTGESAYIRLAKDRGKPNYRRMDDSFGFLHPRHHATVPLSTVYIGHALADLRADGPQSVAMASQLCISVSFARVRLIDRLMYHNGRLQVDEFGLVVPQPQVLNQGNWSLSISVAPVIKQPSPTMGTLIVLLFSVPDCARGDLDYFTILIGFDKAYLPWCCACTEPILKESPKGWILEEHNRLNADSLCSTSLTTKGCVDRLETSLSSGHDLLAVVRRRLPLPDDPAITMTQAMKESGRRAYTYTLNLVVKEPSEWEPDSPQATTGASPVLPPGSPRVRKSWTNDIAGIGSSW
ncbi:hypothetical protein FKW77_001219 [Venturia effusa]|uniref:Heterokaryon incompatibility domain-containing protein n=1 Tax=Venturia effusa TaxID=50376 RepID=A0A517LGH4_9PEZI|nr:hypothetical protein FKW77_001219 [Venturia effusa]